MSSIVSVPSIRFVNSIYSWLYLKIDLFFDYKCCDIVLKNKYILESILIYSNAKPSQIKAPKVLLFVEGEFSGPSWSSLLPFRPGK